MAGDISNDYVQIYIVVCEKDQTPVLYFLDPPFKEMSLEPPTTLLRSLVESSDTNGTAGTKLFLKFIRKNSLVQSIALEQELTSDDQMEGNICLTIDPTKSTAALTTYEINAVGDYLWNSVTLYSLALVYLWNSVTLYSLALVSKHAISSVNMMFGNASLKYKGFASYSFFPLKVNLANDFPMIGGILGEGSYGLVRKYARGGFPCAIERTFGKPSYSACPEVEAMVKLNGAKHVVQMYSAWSQKETDEMYYIYIAMEIFERSLEDYLASRIEVNLPKSTEIFTEIMSGVEAMHMAGVIHRDLKPLNILMDSNDNIAITDFGTSWTKPTPDAPVTLFGNGKLGTPFYCDPIMALTTVPHDQKVDLFSCGIIYVEMHLSKITKRRSFIRELNQKYKYRFKDSSYHLMQSSIFKDWGGDTDILKLTLLVKDNPSRILSKLKGGNLKDTT